MAKITISGHSDDCIEVEGDFKWVTCGHQMAKVKQ